MKKLFQNHFGFIFGFISGIGFALAAIACGEPQKPWVFYSSTLSLGIFSILIYMQIKRNVAKAK